MSEPFANYHKQRAAFNNLSSKRCAQRILLLKGDSGTGKTSLLQTCLKENQPEVPMIGIQLRETSVSVSEIFSRCVIPFGWGKFVNFSKCAQDLVIQTPGINLNNIQQQGATNAIRIALNVQNLEDREYRQTLLTNAWFEDMESFGHPTILLFDTYELAPIEVRNWLSGPFLSRAAQYESVRVGIAGKTVPSAGIEWSQCHALHELFGVSEAAEWLPVLKALGKQVPVQPAETWLAGICHALNGKPSEIMKIVQSLPNIN